MLGAGPCYYATSTFICYFGTASYKYKQQTFPHHQYGQSTFTTIRYREWAKCSRLSNSKQALLHLILHGRLDANRLGRGATALKNLNNRLVHHQRQEILYELQRYDTHGLGHKKKNINDNMLKYVQLRNLCHERTYWKISEIMQQISQQNKSNNHLNACITKTWKF